jgi:hypothetical protein
MHHRLTADQSIRSAKFTMNPSGPRTDAMRQTPSPTDATDQVVAVRGEPVEDRRTGRLTVASTTARREVERSATGT